MGSMITRSSLPVGKKCAARTLLQLFAKQTSLDAATLALVPATGETKHDYGEKKS